jgi:putative transposase
MGAQLLALDGEPDHIHLLVEYPPKPAVSALVNALTGTSSRVLRRLRPDIGRGYWKGVLWCASYFAASTGGATLEKVKQHVEAQRASPVP